METTAQKAQLDEAERSHLEDIVKDLRERAEQTVEYWIDAKLKLGSEDADPPATLSEGEQELRSKVKAAIEREQAGERSWAKARDLYVKGVGYTLVNRLAALRCMEVRGFLDRSSTRFRGEGDGAVTPAADRLINDAFMKREEALWTAFLVACHERSEEIEILFDLSDPYSLLYGDVAQWGGDPESVAWSDDLQSSLVELLQDLGGLLDKVDDAVWRADDVLGWVYEYYNTPYLDDVRKKAEEKGLEPEDIPTTTQFYTPHWVVRVLTDNSLGKLFLERQGVLGDTIQSQIERLTPEERKHRDGKESSSVEELCTYLAATDESGESTEFDHPSEIRVLDPACGSGHFLLYAFDVLERIWWEMAPDVPRTQVPLKILRHNLFGVDLDLRACQLAAFNLYLKVRGRVEEQGVENFSMPSVGIVCADAHVADLEFSHSAFDPVADDEKGLRRALERILTAFKQIEGLGSLLNVKGGLVELLEANGEQLEIFEDTDATTLPDLLKRLREMVAARMDGSSFRAKDLRSFLKLLVILSQDYDVALMNPPYASGKKMPEKIQKYIRGEYPYKANYYVAFLEMTRNLMKEGGMTAMLMPRSFMYKSRFTDFRNNFIGKKGGLEFLTEFGSDIIKNVTVNTVGAVLKFYNKKDKEATFCRLYDVDKGKKEIRFSKSISRKQKDIDRIFKVDLKDLRSIPRSPICYSSPEQVRELYESKTYIDAEQSGAKGKSIGSAVSGIVTGGDDRFLRKLWEVEDFVNFEPLACGGEESWISPKITNMMEWRKGGKILKRSGPSVRTPNSKFYGKEGLTWTRMKGTTRRFGYYPGGLFTTSSFMLFSEREVDVWSLMAVINSDLYSILFLSQTPELEWDAEVVGSMPWVKKIEERDSLSNLARKQYRLVLEQRAHDPTSPHYKGPALLPKSRISNWFYPGHPFLRQISFRQSANNSSVDKSTTLKEIAARKDQANISRKRDLERLAAQINEHVYDVFSVEEDTRKTIRREIYLRTSENPEDREVPDPEEVELTEKAFESRVKHLLLYLSFEIVDEDDDGIVLLHAESDEEEADLLANMIAKFEEIWGEHAEDRLLEVDEVLGDRDPTDEPYPNLRHWLENDLFAFHCDEFENTPILWELTTEHLGEDNKEDTGFACLIDYHQLGPDVFDRLSARYLETRKAALQERLRSARRTADSAEGEQARSAHQEQQRCRRALRQIDALEAKISELTQPNPRDWAKSVRDDARDLKPKVRRFRKRLEERLDTLDELHEEAPSSWFKEHFSDKFMESVNDNREEWIDALEDLEAACKQFARPAEKPVEAHLYDLLPYFDDLVGSTHYSSNGIFFLNYYFSKGKDLAAKIDQGSKDRVTRREQLVADLARATDEDIELGEEIKEACQDMKKHMDSEWKTRALEEVRTPGYRPVKKHGVAINITPLAEKKLVPELVEEKVL